MKKKLFEIFKDRCTTDASTEKAHDYNWYLDESASPIGISKNITAAEKALIELHYVKININKPIDENKLKWRLFLTGEMKEIPNQNLDATYMSWIFFYHALDAHEQQAFDTLVQSFNPTNQVLYLDNQYGVILDFSNEKRADQTEVEDFLMAAIQDFSNGLTFYLTMGYDIDNWLPRKFVTELDLFKTYKDSNCCLMKHKDIFLSYMVSTEVVAEHPIFGDWFRDILLIDAELLAVVKCYLENGFNVTTGAKVMHMHRNTFMNKLDRFIDLTGLDVKQIDEAVIAHLLIRLRRDV